MDLELEGKRVLITGASKGIGLACAAHFLREGARVCIVSRQQKHLDDAMTHLGSTALSGHPLLSRSADLCDASQAQALVGSLESDWGPIDILVNSAGAAKEHQPPNSTRNPMPMQCKRNTSATPM